MRKQYFGVYGAKVYMVSKCILKSWLENEVYGLYGIKDQHGV